MTFLLSAWNAPSANYSVTLEKISGAVRIQRSGASAWQWARTNMVLRAGDRLRTGVSGRVAVKSSDGKTKTYGRGITVTIREPRTKPSAIRSFFEALAPGLTGKPEPKRSRLAAAIRANAAFDGEVLEVALGAQQTRQSADNSEREFLGTIIKTGAGEDTRRMQFNFLPVLYLPDLKLTPKESEMAGLAIKSYQRGNLVLAREQLRGVHSESPRLLVFRAVLEASTDRLKRAAELLNKVPDNSLNHALRTYVKVLRTDEIEGVQIPEADTASANLIASYLHQARNEEQAANDAVWRAADLAPQFGSAWARIAELARKKKHHNVAIKAIELAEDILPVEPNVRILGLLIRSDAIKPQKSTEPSPFLKQ